MQEPAGTLGSGGRGKVRHLGGMSRGRKPLVLYYLGEQWVVKTDCSRGNVRKNVYENKWGQRCSGFECQGKNLILQGFCTVASF